jgi:hypothetical protein
VLCCSVLARHCLASPSRGLGVLSAHSEVPVVPQSSVQPHLLHPLEVVPELGVELVADGLRVLAVLVVLLVVEEPLRDGELQGRRDDRLQVLDLLLSQLTRTAARTNSAGETESVDCRRC